jgi:hypothetical protein
MPYSQHCTVFPRMHHLHGACSLLQGHQSIIRRSSNAPLVRGSRSSAGDVMAFERLWSGIKSGELTSALGLAVFSAGGAPAQTVTKTAILSAPLSTTDPTWGNNLSTHTDSTPQTPRLAKRWGANSIAGNEAGMGAFQHTAPFTSTDSKSARSAVVNMTEGKTITLPAHTMRMGLLNNDNTVIGCAVDSDDMVIGLSDTNGPPNNTPVTGADDADKFIRYSHTRKTTYPTLRNGRVNLVLICGMAKAGAMSAGITVDVAESGGSHVIDSASIAKNGSSRADDAVYHLPNGQSTSLGWGAIRGKLNELDTFSSSGTTYESTARNMSPVFIEVQGV